MRFFENLDRFGDSTALILENGEKRSYCELEQLSAAFAQRVAGAKRTVAFIAVNNCEESVWGYLGCLKAGVVALLLSGKLQRSLLERLIAQYHPRYIWSEPDFYESNPVYRHGEYVLSQLPQTDYPIHPELAMMLTTSGSTGSPKCVRQTWDNLEQNSTCAVRHLGLSPSECFITTLPMNYTYGLMSLQAHLLAGAQLMLNRHTVMSREFWQYMREYNVTSFAGVPFTYEMLRRLHFTSMDLPALRYVTQAGGKLEKEAILYFANALNKQKKDFIVLYGQTEGTCFMSYVPREQQISKAGSIGIAFDCGVFHIEDEHGGRITAPHTTGELVFTGSTVCFGYAEGYRDLALGDVWKGSLPTGDMVQCDEDGYYTIVGRKKRFLKIHGERVNLDEIEQLLRGNGFESACLGTDDHIHIYTTQTDTARVMGELNQLTGINRECLEVTHITEIPRNDSGKILYARLSEQRG